MFLFKSGLPVKFLAGLNYNQFYVTNLSGNLKGILLVDIAIKVHTSTICRTLHKTDLKSRMTKKSWAKNIYSDETDFCSTQKVWGKKILWSDETKSFISQRLQKAMQSRK